MTEQPQRTQPLRGGFAYPGPVRAGVAVIVSALLVAGLGGCRRRALRPRLPLASLAPIQLEIPADQDSLPLIATLPLQDLGPLPLPMPEPAPPPVRRPAAREETQPSAQAAGSPDSAMVAIGALSIGGDAAPQSQQQATDLIASITKRIQAFPARTDVQKQQIRQIRHFLDQAQQALKSGDGDGAINLAIKAKLLMDDLEKK